MFPLSKFLFVGSLCCALSSLYTNSQLSAYVAIPRSTADTTDRMNAGGDPPDRPGLRDDQRSTEFLDDYWGQNDYYYSQYGIQEVHSLVNPENIGQTPPYYPLPNTYYDSTVIAPQYDYNNSRYDYQSTRAYRPPHPR